MNNYLNHSLTKEQEMVINDMNRLYDISCTHYPKIRKDISIQNNKENNYNLLIDNGNSLTYSELNTQLILDILSKYLHNNMFLKVREFIFALNKDISLGVNFNNSDIRFNLLYISKELTYKEVCFLQDLLTFEKPSINEITISNQNFVGITFGKNKLECFKVYNLYYKYNSGEGGGGENLSVIDNLEYQYDSGSYPLLNKFEKYTKNYMFLTRYFEGLFTSKLYFNLSNGIILHEKYIEFFVKLGFSYQILSQFYGKEVLCIASNGGKNLELYINFDSNYNP